MARNSPATPILNGNPIRPRDSADPGEVAWADEVKGGHHQKDTLAERNAITEPRRKKGMTCRVAETGITYVLKNGITNDDWEDVLAPADERINAVDNTKAARDLTNAVSGAVGTRLLAPAAVGMDQLDPTVRASLSGGLDPDLFVDKWNAATNTPTIPAASGNNGKWYWVDVAGTASGNAPGPYVVGDRIVSNGVSWIRLRAPEVIIADGTLPARKTVGTMEAENFDVIVNGVTKRCAWGRYAVDAEGNKLLQIGVGPDRKIINEHIAEIDASLSGLAGYLDDGGIPPQKLETVEVRDVWVLYKGQPKKVAWGRADVAGTMVYLGLFEDGEAFAPTLKLPTTTYILHPQDGGGVAMLDRDSASGAGTPLINDGANWSDLTHLRDDLWTGRTDGLTGAPHIVRIDVATNRFLPLTQTMIFHIGGAGQSLNLGTNSSPLLTTTVLHPGFILMFNAGSQAGAQGVSLGDGSTLTSFVNLLEVSRESPGPGCLNRLQTRNQELFGSRIKILYSNHADGGTTIAQIEKGTVPYANGLTEIARAKAIATAAGQGYCYPATIMTHGESDQNVGTSGAAYEAAMKKYHADLATDVLALTGQAFEPYLFISQTSCTTFYSDADSTIAAAQLSAAQTTPGIVMVGPKYHLDYVDGLHLTNTASRLWGEYISKALEQTLFGKGKWRPLEPISAVQNAGTVTVTFHVPVGDLAFDTTIVSNPGDYGFRLPGATITGVSIVGNTVVIEKTGTATAVQYAWTGTPGNPSGPTTGARGCLFDRDTAVSQFIPGRRLYNPCVHFSIPL